MHIPDGYLSPQTDLALGAASALAIAGAAYQTGKTLKTKYVPLLSIGAAFSFVLMMFNIPIPDGTTAHATGGALLAILLGPWAAMISLSVALVIQALFFGDGGILALGANIFNIGIVVPLVSYYTYKLIAGQSAVSAKRRLVAAAIAGYVGITVGALFAGIEFGLQPALFHAADGTPLYSPYGLEVAVPAMLFAHLTIAGPIEGLVSALVLAYLQRTNPALLQIRESTEATPSSPRWRKLVYGLLILAVLSPLGLLPSGTAWGEWSGEEIQAQLGFIPEGMDKFSSFWTHTLLSDYSIEGYGQAFWQQALGYLISAFLGLLLIGLIALLIQRSFRKGEKYNGTPSVAPRK